MLVQWFALYFRKQTCCLRFKKEKNNKKKEKEKEKKASCNEYWKACILKAHFPF